MVSRLAGKVAIITGGSKGIGRATAIRLAKDGALVVINYSSDAGAAEEAVKEIGSHQCIAIKGDAGNVESLQELVDATVKHFHKIDIVVLNAGAMPMKTLETVTEEDFDKLYALNVKGPLFLAQKAVPYMPSGSRIIFFSSSLTSSTAVAPGYMLYNSTKGAIEQITRVLAKELGSKGITVNAVNPGPTATELFLKGKTEAMINGIKGSGPFGKLGEPEEIADVVAFLSSNESRWVSGQMLRVNGALMV